MVTVTEKMLENGMSDRGGWSAEQIKILGDNIMIKGWRQRLIGKLVLKSAAKYFQEIKNMHVQRRQQLCAIHHNYPKRPASNQPTLF
jgi:hypothetical protein